MINDTVIPDDTDKEEDPDYFDDNHGEDYEDYDYSDDNDYGDYDSVDPDFDEWLDGFALDAGCGAGVSGCETLHAPDCVGRTYIFSPGIVADLDVHGREPHTAGGAPLPSSRVLHPLDSRHVRTSVSGDTVEDRSGGPRASSRRRGALRRARGRGVRHRARRGDPRRLRRAVPRGVRPHRALRRVHAPRRERRGCGARVPLAVHVARRRLRPGRRRAGLRRGPGDNDPEAKRVGLPGHQTYFLAPPGTRYAELGIQRCVQPVKGRNVAPPIPASPDGLPACEALRKPHGQKSYEGHVIWSATLNDGLGAVTLDEIVLTDPAKAAGARVLAGFPLAYVQCGVVDADAGETQTFRACRGVKATEIHVVAPWYKAT